MNFEATLETLLRRIVREELAGVAPAVRSTELQRENLTLDQAAELVSVSKSTITRWVAAGMPSTGKGKMRRVRADDVQARMRGEAATEKAPQRATVTSILDSLPGRR